MKTLAVLKKDMEFNKGLTSLIEVLKNIAVSQYRTLEHRMKTFEKFLVTAEGFFKYLNLNKIDSPFLSPKKKMQLVVAVTSDSGLLGGLNMQVITAAVGELAKIPGKLVVVGERGKSYAKESNMPFTAFGGVKDEERHAQAMQLRDYCIARAREESIGHMKVVFPRPVSFTVQRVEVATFLPFVPSSLQNEPVSGRVLPDIIFESDLAELAEYLVYLWMGQKFFEIFGLSRLAEFAARYVHLEESLQKLKEMDSKLRLQYFRVRHELIDRNMRELFSARLLYASQ